MQFRYTTERLVLMVADENMAPLVLDYLQKNRNDFSRWDKTTGEEFYTED